MISVTVGSCEQRLERPVAEDVVGDLPLEVGALARAERRLLGFQLLADDLAYSARESSPLEVEERGAEPGDAGPVDLRLQLGVRIARARLAPSRFRPAAPRRGASFAAARTRCRRLSSPAPQAESAVMLPSAGVPFAVVRADAGMTAAGLGDRTGERLLSSASTTGSARLTAAGTCGSSGSSKPIFASRACSISSGSTAPAAPTRLATSETRSRGSRVGRSSRARCGRS